MTDTEKRQELEEIFFLDSKLWVLTCMVELLTDLLKSKRKRLWDLKTPEEQEVSLKRMRENFENLLNEHRPKEPFEPTPDLPLPYDAETEQRILEAVELFEKDYIKKFLS